MDPTSAICLATCVLQFVDFASKILYETHLNALTAASSSSNNEQPECLNSIFSQRIRLYTGINEVHSHRPTDGPTVEGSQLSNSSVHSHRPTYGPVVELSRLSGSSVTSPPSPAPSSIVSRSQAPQHALAEFGSRIHTSVLFIVIPASVITVAKQNLSASFNVGSYVLMGGTVLSAAIKGFSGGRSDRAVAAGRELV